MHPAHLQVLAGHSGDHPPCGLHCKLIGFDQTTQLEPFIHHNTLILQTLMAIGFICSIASVAALSAERTGISFVEDLRFDTRSPTGWLLLVNIIALPLAVVLLLLRFLDVRFIIKNTRVFLMVVS